MEENKKLGTLESMTKEIFVEKPEQAPKAIVEYRSHLNENDDAALILKLENPAYNEQFKVAITYTSLIVFIAAIAVIKPEQQIRFDKYVSEYLSEARTDDSDIYKMRLFYLEQLTGAEMGIGVYDGEEELSEEEEALVEREALRSQREYDQLISNLVNKYSERSIHLA